MTASAPGKVLWSGEYAVLDGAPAVVVAVTRRAHARVADRPQRLSPFLEAARREVEAAFGPESAEAGRAARVVVDSRPLEDRGKKLGLGSSAAATVAVIAAAVGRLDLPLIHRLAHRAHGAAQAPRGARGSGADVAASVHGGALVVARPGDADDLMPLAVRRTSIPADITPVLLWTGLPADTPTLVARVRALREVHPGRHAACIDAIARASEALCAALDAGDPARVIAAIDNGSDALRALGDAAGAPLVPPDTAAAARLAARHGGAVKPTGAGGGDVLLAVLPSSTAAAFTDEARSAGMTPISADVSPDGVRLADPVPPS